MFAGAVNIAIVHDGFLQAHVYAPGIQPFAVGHFEKRANYVTANLGRTRIASYAKTVSAACNFHVEAAFDLSQVLIKLSAKIGETVVIGGLQDDILGYLDGVQCRVIYLSQRMKRPALQVLK
jgi:hypothetical protein